MARKSGLSHGLAVLLSLLFAELLVAYLTPHFPGLFSWLEKVATGLGGWVTQAIGVEVSAKIFIPACVAFFLAVMWGILYHLLRHGRKSS